MIKPLANNITLGTNEFEVSNKITIEEIKNSLNLNFKSHYDVYMSKSGNSKTVMVKLIFDNTLYDYKDMECLKNIKEYLKHSKRYEKWKKYLIKSSKALLNQDQY